MKFTPNRPSFLNERDGILQADQNLFGGANRCAIWTVFARHGMGVSAVGNDGTTHIAATDLPADCGGTCSFSINPTSASFAAAGGSGSVTVTTQAGCNWTAVSNNSFITMISGGSGSGSGTVNYSVAANTSTLSRNGSLTIAGLTHSVSQAGTGGVGTNAIVNPRFETGTTPWTISGQVTRSTGSFPHSGTAYMILNGVNSSTGTLFQTVTVPTNGEESEFWIFVGEYGKPSARLFPKTKTYDDYVPPRGRSLAHPPIDAAAVARENDVTFTALGKVAIDGHHCIKIEARRKATADKYYFYVARDLKNLAIVTQLVQPNRSTIQKLTNISLEVPDSLVHIPPDYKSIEHDRWTKLENAIVTYKSKPAKNATVFRSPGGHLFIRVNDWTYLVRPTEATVETAFRGLLVTRTGQFVWETQDTEAYSAIAYKDPRPPSKWENQENKKVTLAPNSVTFRATDYERSKAIIQVRW